ncbi:MAG: thioredoxin domain-containing protein [Xenococcaceae cyanobacterium]
MAKLRSFLIAALFFLFVAGIFWATRADVSAMSNSSVAGLVAIKEMAQQSVPYEVALANGKPTLLEFYADWCTTCQSMAPTLSKLHQQYGERVNFVMLNIDRPEWIPQLKQYQVTGVPQFIFLDSNQEVQKNLVGKVPETIIVQLFEQSSALEPNHTKG